MSTPDTTKFQVNHWALMTTVYGENQLALFASERDLQTQMKDLPKNAGWVSVRRIFVLRILEQAVRGPEGPAMQRFPFLLDDLLHMGHTKTSVQIGRMTALSDIPEEERLAYVQLIQGGLARDEERKVAASGIVAPSAVEIQRVNNSVVGQ